MPDPHGSRPSADDATGRLRPVPERPRTRTRKVTLKLAAFFAALSLAAGVGIGYLARGGPPEPTLLTDSQEIPVVTVTDQAP